MFDCACKDNQFIKIFDNPSRIKFKKDRLKKRGCSQFEQILVFLRPEPLFEHYSF